MGRNELLDAGFARLREVLGKGTGFELVPLSVELSAADAAWAVRSAAGESRLVVEATTAIWPRDVERLARQLRAYALDAGADRSVVVAPSLTRRTRELLRRSEIDYIDLRGDVRVTIPGRLLILTRGDESGSAGVASYRRDRIANPFRGKASR